MNLMIKNKGFTLIELLAIIVILALVMGISALSIGNVINNSRKNTKNSSINNILDATNVTLMANSISIPATFEISNDGVISLVGNSNIKVSYDKEKPNGGYIYVDNAGKITAVGVKFKDGYICTMASGEDGCGKMDAKEYITKLTQGNNAYKSDPSDSERKVYAGNWYINNKMKLSENGIEEDYRIMAVEKDGTLLVIRENPFILNGDGNFAFDSRTTDTTGVRLNNDNTYCKMNGASYNGCNAWQAVNTMYINGTNKGTINTNSEVKQVLNDEYYNVLDKNVRDSIVSNVVSVMIGDKTTGNMFDKLYVQKNGYQNGESSDHMYLQEKIGLISVRDWLLASDNSYGSSPTCIPSSNSAYYAGGGHTYSCSEENYLYNFNYWWWTMSISASNTWDVYRITYDGFLQKYSSYREYDSDNSGRGGKIRPVFYLSNNVQLTGEGTIDNPYRIK